MSLSRMNSEWIAVNAFRGLARIASRGDMSKSTYDNALAMGGELYPKLLGADVSILKRERESDTTKEFRQKADLLSIKNGEKVDPLELVRQEKEELDGLLTLAKTQPGNKTGVDQIKRRLALIVGAEKELEPISHSENQLIFRDAYGINRDMPSLAQGRGYRDFQLHDGKALRVRVLHPDNPEHVTGADIIYERHSPREDKASIVAVQYKLWDEKRIYVSDKKISTQLQRLNKFICEKGVCDPGDEENNFRFPCCAAFIRPTDKLQKPDQKFISTGEHLPICKIELCKKDGPRGVEYIYYDGIKKFSISGDMFEYLFNRGKIGSRTLDYSDLHDLYAEHQVITPDDSVIIYAQEFLGEGGSLNDGQSIDLDDYEFGEA